MSAQRRTLSATDVLYPGPGDVVAVRAGSVMVFAEEPSGRRAPLATVDSGRLLVGCAPCDGGARMLITGLPGTEVDITQLVGGDDHAFEATDGELLTDWAELVTDSTADAAWPPRIVPASRAQGVLPPGEHITTDADQLQWVRLEQGRATLCSSPRAVIDTVGALVLLTPNTWLTTGLRCRVSIAPTPPGAHAWAQSLDRIGQLACAAALDRLAASDAARFERGLTRQRLSGVATREAVDVLTAAIGGRVHVATSADSHTSALVTVTVAVVQASGLPTDEERLSRAGEEIVTGRDALSAVAAACEARVRPVTLGPDWWHHEGSPAVAKYRPPMADDAIPMSLQWQGGHWVLSDAEGSTTKVDAQVAESVDRRVTQLLPVLPQKRASLSDLVRLAGRGSRKEVIAVLGITAAIGAASFLTPYLLGQLSVLVTASAAPSAFAGLFIALFLVVAGLLSWQAVRSLSLLRLRSRAVAVSASAVWDRMMRLPARWHSHRTLGQRLNASTSVNNASAAFPDDVVIRMLDVVIVVGSLAAIATTNSTVLLWLTLLLLAQLLVTAALLRRAGGAAAARMDTAAAANSRLIETLGAVNRLRVAGAESRAFLRWAYTQAAFAKVDRHLRSITMLQGLVIAVWPIAGVLVVVSSIAVSGGTFGDFVTAQTAVTAATAAVAGLAIAVNAGVVARKALDQAVPVLEATPEGGSAGAMPGVLSGALQLRDVVFRYAADRAPVLDGVSLNVTPGEQVAIVGPSGCGKTTLMRLLLGLELPESGVVTVDGRDLSALDSAAVRRQIGSVLQSSSLLPGTIKDNVTMGRHMRTSQVWEALDTAAVGDDVRGMAMGLDTPVTDGGTTLSGGQRQRILIARALAGRPRVLALDEATSALDNLTQAEILGNLQRFRITRVVVAHRLSTVRDSDRIVVMDAGRVVDEGRYEDLMAKPGPFRDLVERQQA